MTLVNTNPSHADLSKDATEEMAKHGITCAQVSLFFYGDYRYSETG